jgi:hypothetical protein
MKLYPLMLDVTLTGHYLLTTVLNSVGTEANGNISIPVFESSDEH